MNATRSNLLATGAAMGTIMASDLMDGTSLFEIVGNLSNTIETIKDNVYAMMTTAAVDDQRQMDQAWICELAGKFVEDACKSENEPVRPSYFKRAEYLLARAVETVESATQEQLTMWKNTGEMAYRVTEKLSLDPTRN